MMEQYGRDYAKETGSIPRQREYMPKGEDKVRTTENLETISNCLQELLHLQKETINGLSRLYQFNHSVSGMVNDELREKIEGTVKDVEAIVNSDTIVMKKLSTAVHAQAAIRDSLHSMITSLEAIL